MSTILQLDANERERLNAWWKEYSAAPAAEPSVAGLPLEVPAWAETTKIECSPMFGEIRFDHRGKAWPTDGASARVCQSGVIQAAEFTSGDGEQHPSGVVTLDPVIVLIEVEGKTIDVDLPPDTAMQLSIAIEDAVSDMWRRADVQPVGGRE